VAVDRLPLAAVGDNCIDRYVPPVRPDTVGGNALNVAAGFAGAGPAVYLGAVGDDAPGRRILETAQAVGIDVGGVDVLPAPTGVTTVELLPDGDRRFLDESYGASALFRLGQPGVDRLRVCAWVHAANLGGAVEAVQQLAAAGHAVSYDFSDRDDAPLRKALCPYLAVAFLSAPDETEGEALALAEAALAEGATLAVVTRGVHGSLAADVSGVTRQEALPVEVIDTLGAGDAFIAAFIAARVGGGAIREALQRAAEAAARTCRVIGPWPVPKEVRV
jgi:fructoselysine 6-kinase